MSANFPSRFRMGAPQLRQINCRSYSAGASTRTTLYFASQVGHLNKTGSGIAAIITPSGEGVSSKTCSLAVGFTFCFGQGIILWPPTTAALLSHHAGSGKRGKQKVNASDAQAHNAGCSTAMHCLSPIGRRIGHLSACAGARSKAWQIPPNCS